MTDPGWTDVTGHKTLAVAYRASSWKIIDTDAVVGSYRNRALATRRAVEKAQAAAKRGGKVKLIVHNKNGDVDTMRVFPTVRKPRANQHGGGVAAETAP